MPIEFNSNNPGNTLQLIAADKQFIDLVDNRITGYGQIPYTVPQKLIIDVIFESARYFYRHYWRATERTFHTIKKADIITFIADNHTYGYKTVAGFMVTLPSFVNVVKNIHETDKPKTMSDMLVDSIRFTTQNALDNTNSRIGINSHLYAIDVACRMVAENAYNSVFGKSVLFSYNNITNQLFINNVIKTYVLECETNINIQFLYRDDLFIRHVIGCVKRELKRVLGSHTIQLPGEATMNIEEICNNLEDIEKVEEILKLGGGLGDIIMMG